MSTTVVSGYWRVTNKHGHSNYDAWFENTLAINAPYVFFGDKESIAHIRKYRDRVDAATHYIELPITEFTTYPYKDKVSTHPRHAPSRELQLIWYEKIYLLQRAAKLNPFNSEWFAWLDAGICTYRDSPPPPYPWPDKDRISALPKDRFIYTSSEVRHPVRPVGYCNHHVSGTYIINIAFIERYSKIYTEYLQRVLTTRMPATDQILHSLICFEHPELFYKLADGYGAIMGCLEKR